MKRQRKGQRDLFDDDNPEVKCPNCGNVARLDDYDVAGADDGNIFCNACTTEFPYAPGVKP